MRIVELRPELYLLGFPIGQCYIWRDGDAVTLIDTGARGSGPAIAQALHSLGLPPVDVIRVVLTHFHDDHAGSAAEVGTWGQASVLAHALDAPIIRGERPGSPPNFTDDERVVHARVASELPPAPPARVDRELRGGDVLDVGGGAQVISTPGHTDGSIALYLPVPRVLFTGDTMAHFEGRVILGPFNLDRAQAMTSLRMLAELDVDVACFGHGDAIVSGASGPLRAAAATLSEP